MWKEGRRCRSDFREGVTKDDEGVFLAVECRPRPVDCGADTLRSPDLPPRFDTVDWADFAGLRNPPRPRLGVVGNESLLTRDDFLLPFSKTVVGPSAAKDFHGGETARDDDSRCLSPFSLRRFAGLWMMPPSTSAESTASADSATAESSLSDCEPWSDVVLRVGCAVLGSDGQTMELSASAGVTSSIQLGSKGVTSRPPRATR